MPLTLTRVTGPVVLPNGTRPDHGQMSFALRDWDRVLGVTIAPGPILAAVGAGGAFEVDLQSSTEADRGIAYDVTLTYWADGAQQRVGFPPIGVPASGPVTLDALLSIPVTTPTAPDVLAQAIAAMLDARDYAAEARASAGIAGGANVYPTTAAGLAATDVGSQFGVVVGVEVIWYRHDAGPVATEIARYATAADVAAQITAETTARLAHVNATNNPHIVTKAQVGLGNADNTSDANKPISTATQAALTAETNARLAHVNATNNPHIVTKAQVGLGNADNTSDANKPISTATQAALTAETNARTAAVSAANQARIDGDAALSGAITAEATARAVAVSTADQARVDGDADLQAQLDASRVDSPVPIVFAQTDEGGNARFIMRLDGSIQSVLPIVAPSNAVDLPAIKYAETDVAGFARVVQRADGEFASADPLPPRGLSGDTHLLIVGGQSPFMASATTAVSTSPVAGLKMFNVGVKPTGGQFADPTSLTGFVDHVEGGNESSARGMAEGLVAGSAAMGRSVLSGGAEVVTVLTAVGGQSINALGPGGEYWHYNTVAVDRWAAICAATGKTPGQVFFGVWQGEADTSIPIGAASWAAKWEAARAALEAYVVNVLGYTVPVVMVKMQTCAFNWYNRPYPLISEGANVAAKYARIFGGLATYDFSFGGADSNGAHLSTALDAFHAGWRCGYAIGQCYAGVAPEQIKPIAALRIGPRAMRVDYGGGYSSPLTLDASIVTNPGDFGFELGTYDAEGLFTGLALASVTVAGGEAVILRTTSDMPAGRLVVRYAYRGGTGAIAPSINGSFSGRDTGARGCLQSATGRTFTFNGVTVTEYLRPPIHNFLTE